jgi:hypothetical protein
MALASPLNWQRGRRFPAVEAPTAHGPVWSERRTAPLAHRPRQAPLVVLLPLRQEPVDSCLELRPYLSDDELAMVARVLGSRSAHPASPELEWLQATPVNPLPLLPAGWADGPAAHRARSVAVVARLAPCGCELRTRRSLRPASVVAGPAPNAERLAPKHAKGSWWPEDTSGGSSQRRITAAWLGDRSETPLPWDGHCPSQTTRAWRA